MQWWIWLLAAVALLIVEVLTPGGFYFIFFGLGAALTAALAFAGVDSLTTQSIVFLGVSVASLLLFRKPLLTRFQPVAPTVPVDSLIGEIATPSSDLHPGDFGQAELRGSSWKVRNIGGVTVRAGQRCIVEQVDGLTIHIRAAE